MDAALGLLYPCGSLVMTMERVVVTRTRAMMKKKKKEEEGLVLVERRRRRGCCGFTSLGKVSYHFSSSTAYNQYDFLYHHNTDSSQPV